jgi:putative methyltransferase (TIGR04325 family)
MIKDVLKLFAPPILVQAYRALCARVQGGLYLSGDYSSWGEALAASTGYDSEIILEKTRTALLKVKRGEAAYERDSVLFDEIQYSWPLLAGLMWVAAQSGGRLNVLDFGGSLGSTYFQNRRFLERLSAVRWNIIEQPRWVEVGKAEFEDEHLKFYGSIEDCLAETQPNVIVLSSVLQYLEHPFDVLHMLSATPCNHLIIDRTPFWDGPTDRLCVQHVPASIYAASYPSWIFSLHRFRSFLNESWEVVAEFEGFDRLPSPVKTTWKGIIAYRQGMPFRISDR